MRLVPIVLILMSAMISCSQGEKRTETVSNTDTVTNSTAGNGNNNNGSNNGNTDNDNDNDPPATDTVPKQDPPMSMADKALLGRHNLTLQWVGWTNPGIAVIEKAKDGWYTIKGRQEGSSGYVLIDGKLRPVFENTEDAVLELEFDGRIESKAPSVNGNEACVRKGKQKFLSTQGRKYWRLQQMINCDSTSTDYVDIYF